VGSPQALWLAAHTAQVSGDSWPWPSTREWGRISWRSEASPSPARTRVRAATPRKNRDREDDAISLPRQGDEDGPVPRTYSSKRWILPQAWNLCPARRHGSHRVRAAS